MRYASRRYLGGVGILYIGRLSAEFPTAFNERFEFSN